MSRDCGRVGECTYQRKQLDLTLFENKIGMNENVRLGGGGEEVICLNV